MNFNNELIKRLVEVSFEDSVSDCITVGLKSGKTIDGTFEDTPESMFGEGYLKLKTYFPETSEFRINGCEYDIIYIPYDSIEYVTYCVQ